MRLKSEGQLTATAKVLGRPGLLCWSALLFGWALSCSGTETATLSLDPTSETTDGTTDGDGLGGETGDGDNGQRGDEDGSDSGNGGTEPAGTGDGDGAEEIGCSAGCPEEISHCLNDRCAECTEDSHCEDSETCELATGLCRSSCTTTEECSGDEFCSPSGICLECAIDADCSSEEENICSEQGQCVECFTDDDCSEQGICDERTQECVECLTDNDCLSLECDIVRQECVE